ncbi:MAG TPA: hypothetical protein VMK83_08300 [Gaiellaceae bacterium]|nr:hypothetical protein [Gaiellaceae bacterium]
MLRRLGSDRALLALGVLVAASTAARFALSRGVDAPWIASDEHLYGLLGRSLVGGDGLTIVGGDVPFYSLLYPLFVGVPLVGDIASGVTVVQALQALVMSGTALPVFLWARPLAGGRLALLAAALTVLIPGLAYSGLLMSEALYYPVAVVATWALAGCLQSPTLARQGLLLTAIGLTLATRLQGVGLVATVVVALGLLAVAERSTAPFRRLLPTLAALGAGGAVWIVGRLATGGAGETLGAYSTLSETGEYSLADVASSVAWQAGAVALLTVGIPLVALGVLAWETLRGREQDSRVRALVVAALAYLVVTVVMVGAFASRFIDHITERQLLSVAPPVFVVFAVWLARGLPRPQPTTSIVAITVAASALLLPIERITTRAAAADALSTVPLEQLRRTVSDSTVEAIFAGTIATLLLLAVLLPRRAAPLLAGTLVCALAAGSVVASLELRDRSRIDREVIFGDGRVDWLDSSGGRDVAFLVTGDREWPSVWHHLFWNSSIERVVRLRSAESPGVVPQEVVTVRADGILLDDAGEALQATELAAPTTLRLSGEPLAALPQSSEQPGMTLWRAETPVRILQRITGLRPNGDLHGGESALIEVFACGPGELQLTLLGKQGLPTRIRLGGAVLAERAIVPEAIWRAAVPAPPGADGSGRCVYELETEGLVGSTRLEFVRAG